MKNFLNKAIFILLAATLLVALHSANLGSLQFEESEISSLLDEENSDDCESKVKLTALAPEEFSASNSRIYHQIFFQGFALKEFDSSVPTSPPNA